MDKFQYMPIVKTTDAEIKGYGNLSSDVRGAVLPVFELTRSRPIKDFPAGDIHRRMEQLGEVANGNPFILDLTAHEDLSNDQIIDLQDDTNGFQEWRRFLEKYRSLNIIPILHLYPDDLSSYVQLAASLAASHQRVAFRASTAVTPGELISYIEAISSIVDLDNQYILVLDAEFITPATLARRTSEISALVSAAVSLGVRNISINSSSFPSSVVGAGGGDEEGRLPILERTLFSDVRAGVSVDANLHYGDYGGIHPIRNVISGGNWVPRIDVSLDDEYIYKRFRRDDGGYIQAAREMVDWSIYDPADCWGREQIEAAALGEPGGRSPSFWIAVRLNLHITRHSATYRGLI